MQTVSCRQIKNQKLGAELLLGYAVHHLAPQIEFPPVWLNTTFGKPFLPQHPAFHFNRSHSKKWVVLAVGAIELGIDLEKISYARDHIIRRYFHPIERQILGSLPVSQRITSFYEWWVLKESYLKAIGTGLSQPLSTFAVQAVPTVRLLEPEDNVSLALVPFPDSSFRLGLCVCTHEMPGVQLHQLQPEDFK